MSSVESIISLTFTQKVFNNVYLVQEILKWLRFKQNTSPLKLLHYRRISKIFNETILIHMPKRTWWSLTKLRFDLSNSAPVYPVFDREGNLYTTREYRKVDNRYLRSCLVGVKPRTRISIYNLVNFLRFLNGYTMNCHYTDYPTIVWQNWIDSNLDDMKNPTVTKRRIIPPDNIKLIISRYKFRYTKKKK
jgi:hypothetical protein